MGAILAWRDGYFHWGYFLLTLVGIVCVNAGLDMSNDYFDHVAGTDDVNETLTPFSGGSRVIQEGVVTARQVLVASLACYAVGIAIGLYLAVTRGWPVLWLGLIGVFLAFFHNAPPVRIYNIAPGLGELAVGIGCGPLVVMGTYYVQAQQLPLEAILVSIPVGCLIAAVLYINEFPDIEADRIAGKKTVPVVVGRRRAVVGYIALIIASYASILVGALLGIFPYTLLIALLGVPLAFRAIRGAQRFHSDTPQLIPVMAATIQLHLMTGVLLCAGYVIAGVLG
ncbi:MAG: 1,4-dihydroxy-2-naphthoate octaprenyltransferase [Chloroflexi bacterium RBG_13_56_8]|nr:MAG: 1,4-dihydroxy-2-naphthoate octaprenyltransferase [Chloroflexi bacterium RBG_13_56_8]